jgi:hypothetical protein
MFSALPFFLYDSRMKKDEAHAIDNERKMESIGMNVVDLGGANKRRATRFYAYVCNI